MSSYCIDRSLCVPNRFKDLLTSVDFDEVLISSGLCCLYPLCQKIILQVPMCSSLKPRHPILLPIHFSHLCYSVNIFCWDVSVILLCFSILNWICPYVENFLVVRKIYFIAFQRSWIQSGDITCLKYHSWALSIKYWFRKNWM